MLARLAALDRPADAGVRWTPPAQWHVTLRFLGEVDEGDVGALRAALRTAAVGLAPSTVTIAERTARFGSRVVHVTVTGLREWAEAIESATAGFGGPPDGRAFVGHVTLGRARDPRRRQPLPLVGVALPPGPRSWTASSFDLVRSHLGSGPATYETVESFPV